MLAISCSFAASKLCLPISSSRTRATKRHAARRPNPIRRTRRKTTSPLHLASPPHAGESPKSADPGPPMAPPLARQDRSCTQQTLQQQVPSFEIERQASPWEAQWQWQSSMTCSPHTWPISARSSTRIIPGGGWQEPRKNNRDAVHSTLFTASNETLNARGSSHQIQCSFWTAGFRGRALHLGVGANRALV